MTDSINIKDVVSQTGVFDTDQSSAFDLKGTKDVQRDRISPEFASLLEGTKIVTDEISGLLDEILNGDGVNGVTLTQLSLDSFTLDLSTAGGTTDTIIFRGAAVASAIAGADTGKVDVKNARGNANDFGIFNTDISDRFTLGGSQQDKTRFVSQEFGEIVNGSRLSSSRVAPLLEELILGDGIKNVDLVGLSSDSFTIQLNTATGGTDTILFEGEVVKDAITGLTTGNVNIPDGRNQFGVFVFDSSDDITERFTLGGDASQKSLVSSAFDDLIEGSKLAEDEVESIFLGARDGSLTNVDLLSVTSASHFTVALNIDSRGTQDIITFIDTAL